MGLVLQGPAPPWGRAAERLFLGGHSPDLETQTGGRLPVGAASPSGLQAPSTSPDLPT